MEKHFLLGAHWEKLGAIRAQTLPSKLSPALYKLRAKHSAIPPQKQKNADFLKFFESKSCSVQKVAVLLHSLTEKTGVPVSSERQQKVL